MAESAAVSRDVRAGLLDTVDNYITEYSAHEYQGTKVGEILDHVTDTRGKMVRPKLLLLSGEFGPDYERVQDRLCKLAALVELTHMASLIHDDIVDDAPLRRGKPSLQKRFGKDAAVYAGDFLMSNLSFRVIKEKLNDSGLLLIKAVEKMCTGEIGQSTCRYREDVKLKDYLRNIHGKTAVLFMTACHIGAEESGCDKKTVRLIEKLGECIGIMFQLRDDILDFTYSAASIGKVSHKDFRDGIYTMPVICALGTDRGAQELLPIMRANADGSITDGQVLRMEQLIYELGGIESTRQEIRRQQQCAESILRSLPRIETSSIISSMIEALCEV